MGYKMNGFSGFGNSSPAKQRVDAKGLNPDRKDNKIHTLLTKIADIENDISASGENASNAQKDQIKKIKSQIKELKSE